MGLNISNDATHNTLVIQDSNGVSPDTYIHKSKIVRIGAYFQANTTNGLGMSPYGYGVRTPGRTTKTIITLILSDRTEFTFDCDEVLNQAGWQGCDLAALNQCSTDINSWLS